MPNIDPQTERTLRIEKLINTNFSWPGKPLGPDYLTLYKGNVVGFSNTDCRDAFAKLSAFFERKLPQKRPSKIAEAFTSYEEILSHQKSPFS